MFQSSFTLHRFISVANLRGFATLHLLYVHPCCILVRLTTNHRPRSALTCTNTVSDEVTHKLLVCVGLVVPR